MYPAHFHFFSIQRGCSIDRVRYWVELLVNNLCNNKIGRNVCFRLETKLEIPKSIVARKSFSVNDVVNSKQKCEKASRIIKLKISCLFKTYLVCFNFVAVEIFQILDIFD